MKLLAFSLLASSFAQINSFCKAKKGPRNVLEKVNLNNDPSANFLCDTIEETEALYHDMEAWNSNLPQMVPFVSSIDFYQCRRNKSGLGMP
jgi:hypothetical protein